MFTRLSAFKSNVVSFTKTQASPSKPGNPVIVNPATGLSVDASCNDTITLTCLAEIYNYTGFHPKNLPVGKNSIGVTGYLDEFANFQNLQTFYADQLPQAVGSSFEVKLVNGGTNSQDLDEAGVEANLDVQFGFGVSFPTPGLFWSTGGSPPFVPDILTPVDFNEPYVDVTLPGFSFPSNTKYYPFLSGLISFFPAIQSQRLYRAAMVMTSRAVINPLISPSHHSVYQLTMCPS